MRGAASSLAATTLPRPYGACALRWRAPTTCLFAADATLRARGGRRTPSQDTSIGQAEDVPPHYSWRAAFIASTRNTYRTSGTFSWRTASNRHLLRAGDSITSGTPRHEQRTGRGTFALRNHRCAHSLTFSPYANGRRAATGEDNS